MNKHGVKTKYFLSSARCTCCGKLVKTEYPKLDQKYADMWANVCLCNGCLVLRTDLIERERKEKEEGI